MDRSDSGFAAAHPEQAAAAALADWMLRAAPFPALVITADARILYSNALARDVLSAGDGLQACNSTLSFPHEADRTSLNKVLQQETAASDSDDAKVLRIDRPSNKRAFALTILPIPDTFPSLPMWIVLISDTSDRMSLRPHWIEAMFDVTRGEARVLALVSAGMSAEDIGATLDIATATVRVHLRNVYRKLKINRQSDLVATILKAIMPMCAYESARDAGKVR